MASLSLLSEDGRMVRRWEIGERPVAVGRGASMDVKIEDEGLSRRHFMIEREGEDYVIKDLNSRNGTWVDGERALLTARLQEENRILAGRTQFRFSKRRVPEPSGLPRNTGPHGTVVLECRGGESWRSGAS